MEKFLNEYIEQMRPMFMEVSGSAAHELASAFLAYRFGIYSTAVRECTHALAHIPAGDQYDALRKAVSIVQANAQDLENSQVVSDRSTAFSGNEIRFIAINLAQEKIEDPATLGLDNALILVYTVALLQSPDDEQALDEHRPFIVRLLVGYKKALGIP
jgi:hypothetical protein